MDDVLDADVLDGARTTAALTALGVRPGDVLLVHASLRSLGPVAGGARGVLGALRRAVGPAGTLVVPAFTPENSDTSPHYRERVRDLDAGAVDAVRASMEPYDPALTPAPSMGALAETVRTAAGAGRSAHPQTSFAALGPDAARLLAGHRADCHLGEDSPLARLYEADARILLLGTGYATCTAFHLGEYRMPGPPRRSYRCVVTSRGCAGGGSTRMSPWTTGTSPPWARRSRMPRPTVTYARAGWARQPAGSSACAPPSTSPRAGSRSTGRRRTGPAAR